MSEFKYACPVCGQHIKCDSSQAGTQMECPTCFQKITVPQAPASEEQKFIITGSKKGDRPVPKIPEGSNPVLEKKSPLAVVLILLILIGGAGAAVYAFRDKIFHHDSVVTTTTEQPDESGSGSEPKKVVQANPQPANDTNWTFSLDGLAIPEAATAGWIHGQQFTCDRAVFSTNGTLTLRGPPDLSVAINFNGAQAAALSEKSINVKTNADKAARVTFRWKTDGQSGRQNFDRGYALRLEFGVVANNRLSGKIYMVAPDAEKSYVVGTFNAEIRKPKPPK